MIIKFCKSEPPAKQLPKSELPAYAETAKLNLSFLQELQKQLPKSELPAYAET